MKSPLLIIEASFPAPLGAGKTRFGKWCGGSRKVLCLNGAGCRLECSGSSMGWEVCRMVSKQLPRKVENSASHWFATTTEPNIATAGYCGQVCNTLLHLRSNRFVCCRLFYSWAIFSTYSWAWDNLFLRRRHSDSRDANCESFRFSPTKPRKPDVWRHAQFKLGRSNSNKQSANLDIWQCFQPEHGSCEAAKQSSEPDIWVLFQPEHGLSKSAKQSSELDIWPLFQS